MNALTVFHFGLIFFLAWSLARRWGERKNKLFWSAFVIHLLAGLSVGLVYRYYYSANDTWSFFEGARQLSKIAKEDFSTYLSLFFSFDYQEHLKVIDADFRSLVFVKILGVVCLLSGDDYWICTGYFSLLSFTSSWFLYRKVILYFKDSTVPAAIAFLFFPSVVFWSSGIEKETLTVMSLYFVAGILLQIWFEKKINAVVVILALLAFALLWTLKYYWAGVFFISSLSAFVVQLLSEKFIKINKYRVAVFAGSFAIIGVISSLLHPNFYLHRFLDVIVSNHEAFVKLSNSNNLIHYNELSATYKSILINSPWALFSGIFRPVVGEGQGIFGMLASAENLVILILFISLLWRLKQNFPGPISLLMLAVIGYCIVLCVFLSLSTPNLGTLSRYRVGFLPFLIFIIAYRNPLVDLVTKKFLN